MRRLDIAYVHATDAWIDSLPDRARRWLNDPQLFELLVQDRTDSLYRVRQAFLKLEATPASASYEALRRAVPPSATVYLAPTTEPAHALALRQRSHMRSSSASYSRATCTYGPTLGSKHSVRVDRASWLRRIGLRRRCFRDRRAGKSGGTAGWRSTPLTAPPIRSCRSRTEAAPPISVHVSDGRAVDERMSFDLTLTNRTPERWSGRTGWFCRQTSPGFLSFPVSADPTPQCGFPARLGRAAPLRD